MEKLLLNGQVYVNLNDTIKLIELHKKKVVEGRPVNVVTESYATAHDHIIEILSLEDPDKVIEHYERNKSTTK